MSGEAFARSPQSRWWCSDRSRCSAEQGCFVWCFSGLLGWVGSAGLILRLGSLLYSYSTPRYISTLLLLELGVWPFEFCGRWSTQHTGSVKESKIVRRSVSRVAAKLQRQSQPESIKKTKGPQSIYSRCLRRRISWRNWMTCFLS